MSPRWKRVSRDAWEIKGVEWSGSVEDFRPDGWAWTVWRRDAGHPGYHTDDAPTLLLAQLAVEDYVCGRRGKR